MDVKEQTDENSSKSLHNKYGNGVAWCRGKLIGKGSFGSVFVATIVKRYTCFPPLMAVKSAEISISGSIQKEKEVLNNIMDHPNVIQCYGDETTTGENGEMVYNLLLEYASGGTLADLIRKSGGIGLPESDVRYYTRSILRGLCRIHSSGYVHCDLKPDNIFLVRTKNKFRVKIGDFGLAKRATQSKKRKLTPCLNGTPMYMSPEAMIDDCAQQSCSDIWSLGCIVLEMLTGKSPWESKKDLSAKEFLRQVSQGKDLPKIPNEISKEGKVFLKGCFARNVKYRLTAEKLLSLPFVEGDNGNEDDEDELGHSEDVFDVNDDSTVVVDNDDEFCGSWSSEEWSFTSEQELFCDAVASEKTGNQVLWLINV